MVWYDWTSENYGKPVAMCWNDVSVKTTLTLHSKQNIGHASLTNLCPRCMYKNVHVGINGLREDHIRQ